MSNAFVQNMLIYVGGWLVGWEELKAKVFSSVKLEFFVSICNLSCFMLSMSEPKVKLC